MKETVKLFSAYVIVALIIAGVMWSCDREYYQSKSFQSIGINGEVYSQERLQLNGDTCIGELIPHPYDFVGNGTIAYIASNPKPYYNFVIWSYSDSTSYDIDSSNDTIRIYGDVYFVALNELNQPVGSVTINDTYYPLADTISLGDTAIVWSVCVNPLVN